MEKQEIKKYLKSLFDYMAEHGYTTKPYPKIVLDYTKQDGVLVPTGYFDPTINGIRLFMHGGTSDRALKDVLRTAAHEFRHWKQQIDGTIAKSGYSGNKITEDKKLIKLEADAYLYGNIGFRKWTEWYQKNNKE
jgi:hypothetical protein